MSGKYFLYHCNLLSTIPQDTNIDFKLQNAFCNSIQNACDHKNKDIKLCMNLVTHMYPGHEISFEYIKFCIKGIPIRDITVYAPIFGSVGSPFHLQSLVVGSWSTTNVHHCKKS